MAYVKKRKLSIAAVEICRTDYTILEIALKFGYKSHESFTRAFKDFHGFTPSNCRKFGFYNVFQKICIEKGMLGMVQLSENVEKILNLFDTAVSIAKQTGEKTIEISKNSKNFQFFKKFAVIGSEIILLSDRMESTKIRIKEIESFMQTEKFFAIEQGLEIIKSMDDFAFQANILAFNANLEIAPTSHEYRKELFPIGEQTDILAKTCCVKKDEITILFNELGKLIFEDLQSNVTHYLEKSFEYITIQLTKIFEGLDSEAKKAGVEADSYLVIADEINNVKNELIAMSHNELNNLFTKTDINLITRKLENSGFRLNILAFDTMLEYTRISNYQGFSVIAKQIINLAGFINKSIQEILEFPQLEQPKEYVISISKQLEDVAYQGNILYFYSKTEFAKLKSMITEESKVLFQNVLKDIASFIDLIKSNKRDSEVIKISLNSISNKFLELSETERSYCSTLLFFSKQFETLSEFMSTLSDDEMMS